MFAGKIVSKKQVQQNQLLQERKLLNMLGEEIVIHRWMVHKHIVGFHSFFEHSNFVFIVLELCKGGVSALPFHFFFRISFFNVVLLF
jgi:polo-like kinase 1